jgi:hypothetical protein
MRVDMDKLVLPSVPMHRAASRLAAVMASKGAEVAVQSEYTIKNINQMEQIVYGEVYAPYVIDSHGEMMLPEDIRKLAHRFLIAQKNHYIDIMHQNVPVTASIVESYIARPDDPDYTEGSWVLAVKIFDDNVWQDILDGKLNGYSLEAMVYKVDAEVVYDYLPIHIGFVEDNDGHYHSFYVEVNKEGRVTGGSTSEELDNSGILHSHSINFGTATESNEGHNHRYFLNEITT